MEKRNDYLVYLKDDQTRNINDVTFKAHVPYRCSPMEDSYIVYGIAFTQDEFDDTFEYVLDRAKVHFEDMGLLVNGKPVTKTRFKKLSDIHTYTSRTTKLHIIFFHGADRINYGFYGRFNKDTQAQVYKDAYQDFINFLEGESAGFEGGNIQFGNCGIPIGYCDLRVM